MAGWVAKIKECIARANVLYESETLPTLRAREDAERQRKFNADRRVKEARRKAEGM